MFRITEDPSSGSPVQCFAKILNKVYNTKSNSQLLALVSFVLQIKFQNIFTHIKMLKFHKTSAMFRSPYDHPQGVCQSLLKLRCVP